MNHPNAELLLRFAEGETVPAAVRTHLAECEACQEQLAQLGKFEAQLATSSTMSPSERQALRAISVRTLAAAARPSRLRLVGLVAVAMAACLLATWSLWSSTHGLCDIGVRRYVPDNVVRAERLERFSMAVQVDAPRWLGLWQLDSKDSKRLMPNDDPLLRYLGAEMPLAAGSHRLPAAEVLDFEFASDQPPSSLLLVASTTELSASDLSAIEQLIATTPRPELLKAVQAKWFEARVLEFPAR